MQVLLENLLVCGGGSSVEGLSTRLLKELQLQLQPSAIPATISTPEYMPSNTLQHSVWVGGAVLSKVAHSTQPAMTYSIYSYEMH